MWAGESFGFEISVGDGVGVGRIEVGRDMLKVIVSLINFMWLISSSYVWIFDWVYS